MLREPAFREHLQLQGGTFWYENPVELGEDMVSLKRAFPEIRFLVVDSPRELIIGFVGMLPIEDEGPLEQEIWFRIRLARLKRWAGGNPEGVVAELFKTAEGRLQFITYVADCALRPEPSPEPEPEEVRRTLWERLADDLV